jgi:hypothetical protein
MGADTAEATFDPTHGHLVTLDLDYDAVAIDDEACDRISAYSPG